MQAQFGDFCLDTDRRELSSRGVSIHVTPKALQLLQLLVERRPRVLGKEEIYEALWPGTFVEESNLSVLVAEVRAALGDEARRARFVKTAHGFGYGFIADVASTSTIRLRSGSREFELIEGDNIVGRDSEAKVRINAPGISRRHARITIRAGRAVIEDLGSKNGTFVRGRRINAAEELRDGDEIRVSRELLIVLNTPAGASTITEMSGS